MACSLIYYFNSFCYPNDRRYLTVPLTGPPPITVTGIVYRQSVPAYSGCAGGQSGSYILYVDGSGTNRETAISTSTLSPHSILNYYVQCDSPSGTYDCLNSSCVSSVSNNGKYSSLSACQAGCGKVCADGQTCLPSAYTDPNTCPPGQVCIPQDKWAQIENLSSLVQCQICS